MGSKRHCIVCLSQTLDLPVPEKPLGNFSKIKEPRDFPGGPGVKSPLFNSGDTGSIPGRGTKTPQLNP